MMFPFTMICDACGEYNYTGTKFTSKCETIKGESYLGLKVYRFYGRCRHCWAEFTFKTDPKNSDYTMESGGKRTYEAWKDADLAEAQLKNEKEEAEKDQMKALEQKSVDVAAEMQRIEDLDAIRTLNKRAGARDQSIEEALECIFKRKEAEAAAEAELAPADEREVDGFRDAQEERRRMLLDEEVDAAASLCSKSSSSSSWTDLASSTSGAAGGQASALASAVAAATAAASASVAAGCRPGVGARFTVKRKVQTAAIDDAGHTEETEAKRVCPGGAVAGEPADSSGSTVTPPPSADPGLLREEVDRPAAAVGASSGGLGGGNASSSAGCLGLLGTYDSDESE